MLADLKSTFETTKTQNEPHTEDPGSHGQDFCFRGGRYPASETYISQLIVSIPICEKSLCIRERKNGLREVRGYP